ncbi:hypothetical protein AC230_09120 [Streptomyces caatingaensis]|uniref:SdpA family antimicrobial peptide system protein n=1 Tax=Streptomyces caatingaensis TaxID=1678637 RepID=A0A0K9XHC3_9ACTN|nr:hypothetical protein AC230_09120 [Streptomyces caatingaensis]
MTVVAAVWALIAVYVAQSYVPANVVHLPGQGGAKKAANAVAPQGWAFFTKSAKDIELAPYRFRNGRWESAARTPHARPSNAFGLDRASRSQGIELAWLVAGPGIKWTDCTDSSDPADCLAHTPVSGRMTNDQPSPLLCGRAAVVQMRPIPWAWRDLMPEPYMPEKAAVWEVSC